LKAAEYCLHPAGFSRKKRIMHFLKSWVVRCAAVLCLFAISSRAEDTDAQIKAREALRHKMDELQTQPADQTAPPVEAAPPVKKPAPMKKQTRRVEKPTPPPVETAPLAEPPTARPMPPASASAPAPRSKSKRSAEKAEKNVQAEASRAIPAQSYGTPAADPAAIAKAREAVRQKMTEIEAQPEPPAQAPVAVTPAKPEKTKPAKVVKKEKPAKSKAAPVASKADKSAPQQKSAEFEPVPESGAPVASQSSTPPPSQENTTHRTTAAKPQKAPKQPKASVTQSQDPSSGRYKSIEGPASTLPAAKEQQLSDLLRRYQADEITPSQYHQERAKILAAP
jgi:hypothetical protein